MIRKKEIITSAPYSVLAQIYDFVMSHVDYRHWARYIIDLCEKHAGTGSPLLDISCGTGKLGHYLSRMGVDFWGTDYSREMLRIAKNRVSSPLWCGDMRFLSTRKKFPVVVSLYDSMNYLLEERDWSKCLRDVHSVLASGGIFIFDISTLFNSREIFRNYEIREKNSRARYIRRSYFDEQSAIQTNEFQIQLRNRKNLLFYETHRQRIRDLYSIDQFINNSPLEVVARYNEFSFIPATEKAERVHYVLKRND